MKNARIATALALTLAAGGAVAQGAIDGTYESVDGFGYMDIQRVNAAGLHRVTLMVSGGSCGGEVLVDKAAATLRAGELGFDRRDGRRTCRTTISVTPGAARVSDSCITPESEEGSTCALLGDYEKQAG